MPNDMPPGTWIAELAAADPAAAPDIADKVAVRLEADLAAASNRALDAPVTPEPS